MAGTLNVIAGGGSLLTLPVMIFLGLPPTVANGTNRVAILIQNVGATWSFHRRKLISKEWVLLAVPPALVGVVFGTLAAVRVGDLAFQKILAVVLVGAAAWSVWRPVTPPEEGSPTLPREEAMGLRHPLLSGWCVRGVHSGGSRFHHSGGDLGRRTEPHPGQRPEGGA